VFAKSDFRKGSDALPGVVANQQVGSTFSEIVFGNRDPPLMILNFQVWRSGF